MPKVPTYDALTVEQRSLPGVRQQSVASPELLGAGAADIGAFGKGLLRTGNALAEIAVKRQEEKDLADVTAAYAKLAEETLTARQWQKRDLAGKQAEGLGEAHLKWYDSKAAEIGGKLENENQKKAFAKLSMKLRLSSYDEAAAQEVSELHSFSKQSTEALLNTSINFGAAAILPQSVQEHYDTGKAALTAAMAQRGITPDSKDGKVVFDNEMLKYTTTFHTERIKTLIATGDTQKMAEAERHFNKFLGEIAPEPRAALMKAFTGINNDKAALALVNDIMATNPTRAAALDAVREKLKEEPAQLEKVVSELKTRFIEKEQDARERQKKVRDPAHIVISQALQTGRPISLRDPKIKALLSSLRAEDPESEHWASSTFVAFNEHLAEKARVEASRGAKSEEAQKKYAENFSSLLAQYNNNPVAFASVNLVGDSRWWGLTESDRQEIQRLQKPSESPTLGTMTKMLDTYKGFFKKEYGSAGDEKFDLFTRKVWEQVRAAESHPDAKALKHEDIQKIIDKSLLVTKDRWFGKDERAFEGASAPTKSGTPSRATSIQDVPYNEQVEIRDSARRNGILVTPELVIRKYNEINGYK